MVDYTRNPLHRLPQVDGRREKCLCPVRTVSTRLINFSLPAGASMRCLRGLRVLLLAVALATPPTRRPSLAGAAAAAGRHRALSSAHGGAEDALAKHRANAAQCSAVQTWGAENPIHLISGNFFNI